MSKNLLATLAFAGFALLLAFRDVATELVLFNENALWLSFVVCATICALSSLQLALRRSWSTLLAKLRTPGASTRALLLGVTSGGIYLGIFFLIGRMGAGLWGMIDYGLIPLATAIVGHFQFKERLTRDFFGAFIVYFTGITVLMVGRGGFVGASLIAIAIALPIASALSDGWTKWLLKPTNAALTKSEVLVVRFLPAAIALYCLASIASGKVVPQIVDIPNTLLVSAVGGWMPLMLLCTGLGIAGMKKLAVWEFTIPAATFFGTLHHHPENQGYWPIIGAVVVISGILVSELRLISRWSKRSEV